jgi:hypothetical protein
MTPRGSTYEDVVIGERFSGSMTVTESHTEILDGTAKAIIRGEASGDVE